MNEVGTVDFSARSLHGLVSRHVVPRTDPIPAPRFPAEDVLVLEDLRVWYPSPAGPVRAVDGVDLRLRAGEVTALIGESGSGKSTLGRSLLGLVPEGTAMDGKVLLDGEDLLGGTAEAWRARRGRGLGMIFQDPMTRLDPLMRIRDHFREAIAAQERLSRREADARALQTLQTLGIPPSRYRSYPHELSGGMRQRIMIALALVLRPRVVIADEPTTALDVLVEAQIIRALDGVRRTFSPAMLLITHNLGIVAQICDRVAVMYAGRIVEQGPVDRVFSDPQHPYTRDLLAANISLATRQLRPIAGSPPDLTDPPAGCGYQPRCRHAMAICGEQVPPELRDGTRSTRCFLVSPVVRARPVGEDS